ncbi:MAG: Nucleoside-diphosphate-sugar epimerases, partial [uncultured Acetobacteraceae bacterium]
DGALGRRPPRPGDGRRGLHRLQPRRSPRARRARGARLRRLGATGRGGQPRLVEGAAPAARVGGRGRHPRRGRVGPCGGRGGRGVPLGGAGRGHDQLGGPARRFRGQPPGHAFGARSAAAARRARAARLRQHQQGLRRPFRRGPGARRRRLRSARSGVAGARHRRGPAARLPHALRLLQGRGGPVRAGLRPLLRPAHRGAADELHLRPAPDGHGGPGLDRPLPDPRAPRRADQRLRRRLPGARRAGRGRRGGGVPGRLGADRRRGRARLQPRRRPGQRGEPAAGDRLHRRADRTPGGGALRGVARGRPALLRLRHAPRRAGAGPRPRAALAGGRFSARALAAGRARARLRAEPAGGGAVV